MGRLLSLFVLLSFAPQPAGPASVQTCNTRCQTSETDCILRCDGNVPCAKECQKTAVACVETCGK